MIRGMLAAKDRRDLDAFATCLAEDMRLVFANGEPVRGRTAVVSTVDAVLQSLDASCTRWAASGQVDNIVIFEGRVRYVDSLGQVFDAPYVERRWSGSRLPRVRRRFATEQAPLTLALRPSTPSEISMSKTWLVTGAARGIGAEIVKAALAAGDRVVATGRDAARIGRTFEAPEDRLLPLRLDVAVPQDAEAAIRTAVAGFGRIDVLVNNAGYAQLGIFEEQDPGAAQEQFATNVFGLMNVTRAVLPVMRHQRAGHIINVSSIAGIRGGQGGTLYSASKFAVEGFSESLALEVACFGIDVTLIEPGYFRTDFLDDRSLRMANCPIEDYAEQGAALNSAYSRQNHRQPGDPAKLASLIVVLAAMNAPPLRIAAGSDAVEAIRTKIETLREGLDVWRPLSVSVSMDIT